MAENSREIQHDELTRQQLEQARLRQRQLQDEAEVQQQIAAQEEAARIDTAGAVATSDRVARDPGLVTDIGEGLGYLIKSDGLTADAGNALAAGLNMLSGGNLQGLDDYALGSEERKAQALELAERESQEFAPGGQFEDNPVAQGLYSTENIFEGIESGIEAGVAMPFTIAGRLSNQDTPWSNRPETLKNSPMGEAAFTIAEIVAPTLLTGGLASAYGAPALVTGGSGLVAESLIETATQESAKDLLFGEVIAKNLGDIASDQGYDGAQLTKDLIEGRTPQAQVINGAIGFLQNLGINFGADKLIKYFPQIWKRKVDDVAEVTGKSPEEIAESLSNVNKPEYSATKEPADVQDVDSLVSVPKPNEGQEFINTDSLIAEMKREQNGLADDYLSAADRDYFTNYKALTDNKDVEIVLREITAGFKQLPPQSKDVAAIAMRARHFLDSNLHRLDGYSNPNASAAEMRSMDELLDEISEDFELFMTEPLQPFDIFSPGKGDMPTETYLREGAKVNASGFAAGAVLAEEIGIRLQKQAKAIDSMETLGVDFSTAVDNFFKLQEKSELFLAPLRRGKRDWNIRGIAQQRRFIGELLPDVSNTKPKDFGRTEESSEDMLRVYLNNDDTTGFLPVELWKQYQAGSIDAGETLKAYFSLIANGDPSMAIKEITSMNTTLRDQLKKGNLTATKQLFYSYMLSRLSPQTASLASNIVGLVKDPVGTYLSAGLKQTPEAIARRAYARGQFVGGLSGVGDAFQAMRKALVENRSYVNGTKLDASLYDLTLRNQQLDQTWQGVQKEMANDPNVTKLDKANAKLQYWRQKMANQPFMGYAARGLLAIDEWSKVVYGSQVATARAYKEAAALGSKVNSAELKALVQSNMDKVFVEGKRGGVIKDPEVITGSKYLTFQQAIPSGADATWIDNAFNSLEDAAKGSAFWTWSSPFVKVQYWTTESAGRMLAGSIPGPAGKWLLGRIPRYQKILAGEYGEVAKLKLEGDLAFANTWAYMAAGLATANLVTGNRPPEGYPKTSFIVPMPGTEKGWVAIPYGKLEPVATPTSIIADLAQSVRDDIISEGDYARFMEDTLATLGLSVLDKSFMTSLTQSAALFDIKNFSENSLAYSGASITSTAIGAGGIGAAGGIARMIADWVNPYETIAREDGQIATNIWSILSQRALGGVGLPVMYNPFSGEPIQKRASRKNASQLEMIVGGLLNESFVSGQTKNVDPNNKVLKELNKLGYDRDLKRFIQSFNGQPLSREQQSILSKDLHNYGQLSKKLSEYFASREYKRLRHSMKKFRDNDTLGNTSSGSNSDKYRRDIHSDLNKIFQSAKNDAVEFGRLAQDEDFLRKRSSLQNNQPLPGSPNVFNATRDAAMRILEATPSR